MWKLISSLKIFLSTHTTEKIKHIKLLTNLHLTLYTLSYFTLKWGKSFQNACNKHDFRAQLIIPQKCNHLLTYNNFHKVVFYSFYFLFIFPSETFTKPLKNNLYYHSFDIHRWQVAKCPKALFCLLEVLLFLSTHEFQWGNINAFHNQLVL